MARSRRAPSRRPVRRRRITRRRTTKRRPTVKRTMNRKRILNLTSRKKRDVMQQYSSSNSGGHPLATISPGVQTIPGNAGGYYYWQATARDFGTSPTELGTNFDEATRTATTCYMRGLLERIDIQTSSAVPWRWRRVCITTKDNLYNFSNVDAIAPYNGWLLTTHGVVRPWVNSTINNNDATQSAQWEQLFEGARNIDWQDMTTAKLDTRRVTVHYDKTVTINSGNANGVFRSFKRWHPMNKNIVYADDQEGGKMTDSHLSVTDKRGMGNYIVLDWFVSHLTATVSDVLRVRSNSCLYWHEK